MAFADCVRSIDKGLDKHDLQAAWYGSMGTADGFPAGILADTLGLPDLPVTRIENSCATGNDAVRNALYAVASGAFDIALVMGADKLRDTTSRDMLWEWEGGWPGTRPGTTPPGPGGAGRLRPARPSLSARIPGHP